MNAWYPKSASDITPQMLDLAAEVHDDWFDDGFPIDWDSFFDRMASYSLMDDVPWELDNIDNPAAQKIQRHIRAHRKAGG